MNPDPSHPDILFYFSDQHHGLYAGYAGHHVVETPNLDRIAALGTACETAYTACPLCVPARAALLTGQLTSRKGMFDNSATIPGDQATFLHSLAASGYETVLCGRMHFKGADQRHGFTKRIFGDITSPYSGGIVEDGLFRKTFGMGGCVDLVGAGTSPVLDYDRAVVQAAVSYLSHDHEKPQCMVVGTYGPHFPYVAPPELFDMYRNRVSAPASWNHEGPDENPIVDAKRQRTRTDPQTGRESAVDTDVMLAARSAYFGMITEQDRHVGTVRDAWEGYTQRSNRRGIFVYSSDHGDTCGEHGVFGKQTFYEGAVRIPLIFEGHGIAQGSRIRTAVSITDIAPTLCDLTRSAPPAGIDGTTLAPFLLAGNEPPERAVVSEWVQQFRGTVVAGRMIRRGPWKLMHYRHADIPDQLFNVADDPDEIHNLASQRLDDVRRLMTDIENGWEPERIVRLFTEKAQHQRVIREWAGAFHGSVPETETWRVPHESVRRPDPVV